MNKRFILIGLFLASFLGARTVSLNREEINSISARSIYDLLRYVTEIYGFSYGDIGQEINISRQGSRSLKCRLYLDDILVFDDEKADLSKFININDLDSLTLETNNPQLDGIILRAFSPQIAQEPASQVSYKDAFYNFRDLNAGYSQYFNSEISYKINFEITDYKDKRESRDYYKYPFLGQKYRFFLKRKTKDSFLAFNSFFEKDKKYRLSTDSLLNRESYYHNSLTFKKDFVNLDFKFQLGNRYYYQTRGKDESFSYFESLVNYYKNNYLFENKNLISLNRKAKADFDNFLRLGYHWPNQKFNLVNNLNFLNGDLDQSSFGLLYEFSSRYLEIYFSSLYLKDDFFTSRFRNEINFKYQLFKNDWLKLILSPNIFYESRKDSCDLAYFILDYNVLLGDFNYYSSFLMNMDDFKEEFCYDYHFFNKLFYSKSFFNKDLNFRASIYHSFAKYYLTGLTMEKEANLGAKIEIEIKDMTFYFGVDNFLSDSFGFKNDYYNLNNNYIYQRVLGYKMMTKDEIWGIIWKFEY